jgi:hypothetical protein
VSHPQRVATLSHLPSGLYRRGFTYYGSYAEPKTGKRLRRSLGTDLQVALDRLRELRGAIAPPRKRKGAGILVSEVLGAYFERISVYCKPSVIKQTRCRLALDGNLYERGER